MTTLLQTAPEADVPEPRHRVTVGIVLLTALADLCLYRHPGGAGGAVLMLGTGLGVLLLTPRSHGRGLLSATLFLTAAMMAWNVSPWTALVGAFSAVALAIRSFRPDWSGLEILWALPWTILRAPLGLIGQIAHTTRLFRSSRASDRAEGQPGFRLRVVLVPLAVVGLFLALFSAANPVLERFLDNAWIHLGEWLDRLFDFGRIFTWIGWMMVFAFVLRPRIRSKVAEWLRTLPESLTPPADPSAKTGDFATALATLIGVNLLFLIFNAMDSVYLYFKATLPDGISWAEYSHEGCFWLTMALGLSTAVIGVVFRAPLTFHARSRTLRFWTHVWAAQNLILALGVLRRLQMYIDYNGLTRLRIVGLFGVLLVSAGLAIMVWKMRSARNFLWLVRRDLLAFGVTAALLALTPVDYLCSRYNVSKVMAGNPRPLALLTNQEISPEGYPPLLPLLDHSESWVREGVSVYLGMRLKTLSLAGRKYWTHWQGSDSWARQALEEAREKMESLVPPSRWSEVEKKFELRVRPWLHSRASYD